METKQTKSQKLTQLPKIKQLHVQNNMLIVVKQEQQSMVVQKSQEQPLYLNNRKNTEINQHLIQPKIPYKKDKFSLQDSSLKLSSMKVEQIDQKKNKKTNISYFNQKDSNTSSDQHSIAPIVSLQNQNTQNVFQSENIKETQRQKIQNQIMKQENKSNLQPTPQIFSVSQTQNEDSPQASRKTSSFKRTRPRVNGINFFIQDAQQ